MDGTLAVGAMEGQKAGITSRYGANPDALSHGEWFVNILQGEDTQQGAVPARMSLKHHSHPSTSCRLLSIIKEAVSLGAQFLIATHSPIHHGLRRRNNLQPGQHKHHKDGLGRCRAR